MLRDRLTWACLSELWKLGAARRMDVMVMARSRRVVAYQLWLSWVGITGYYNDASQTYCDGINGVIFTKIKYQPGLVMIEHSWLSGPTFLDIVINGRNSPKNRVSSMLCLVVAGHLRD